MSTGARLASGYQQARQSAHKLSKKMLLEFKKAVAHAALLCDKAKRASPPTAGTTEADAAASRFMELFRAQQASLDHGLVHQSSTWHSAHRTCSIRLHNSKTRAFSAYVRRLICSSALDPRAGLPSGLS